MSDIARETLHPDNGELQQLFISTVRDLGDASIDCIDDGRNLWLRAAFPEVLAVRPGDRLRRGVALRTSGMEVLIHPYTLREVCTNGAVRAHGVGTRIVRREWLDDGVRSAHAYAVEAVRLDTAAALRDCASASAFEEGAGEMRASLEVEADAVIERLQLLDVMNALGPSRIATSIRRVLMRQLRQLSQAGGRERSAFAFGNALTAAGRDAASPAVRWTLEEYGAAVFAAARSDCKPPQATIRGKSVGTASADIDRAHR